MKRRFEGFPREMFDFLEELHANNHRHWFQENRQRYDAQVVAPTARFIEAVGELLPTLSDAYVADSRRHGGSMFRLHRDTRFSTDKRPYKEHVGCQFRHVTGRNAHAPGFYVHLSPSEVFVGGGIWQPDSGALHRLRIRIAERPGEWSSIVADEAFMNHFGPLQGARLKRPPKGFDPQDPHLEDLKRKGHMAIRQLDPACALTPAFFDEVEQAFTRLMPLMRFISRSLGLAS